MLQEANIARTPSNFFAAQRRTMIARLVEENDWVTVRELREITHVSSTTIRRDIRYLATRNLLRPVHGGAISVRANTRFGHLTSPTGTSGEV